MSRPRKPTPTQSTISFFFSQNTPTSRTTGVRPRSPIDLTIGEEEGQSQEPKLKKRRVDSSSGGSCDRPSSSQLQLRPPPLGTTQSRNLGTVGRYRFDHVAPPSGEVQTTGECAATDTAQRQRKDKLRKILNSSNFLRNNEGQVVADDDPLSAEADDRETAQPTSHEADDTFEDTLAFFTNSKAKPVRSGTSARGAAELGPSGLSYTPLELQIRDLKRQHPGIILMFEVGYKFKFFGEDAPTAAKELGIVAFQHRNFMTASIPVHRRDVHLKKLLSQGYRVGIVEQTETAALKKVGDTRNELFSRKLAHLYTAATYVEQLGSADDVDTISTPPLMCLVEELRGGMGADERVSLSMIVVTASTGDVVWDQFEDNHMRTELETRMVHVAPAEVLLPEKDLSKTTEKMLAYFTTHSTAEHRTRIETYAPLSYTDAFSFLSDLHTKKAGSKAAHTDPESKTFVETISNLPKQITIALAQCVKYFLKFGVADTLLEATFFSKFTERTHMLLNGNAVTNLEIYQNDTDFMRKGSLLWVLDRTTTKFGARMLRSWIGRPLTDESKLRERTDAIAEIIATNAPKLTTLRQLLKGLPDLARGLCRIQYGRCTPQELAILLSAFNKIASAFDSVERVEEASFDSNILNSIICTLPRLKEPIRNLLGTVSLKIMAEGKTATMWTDPHRHPELGKLTDIIHTVDSELSDELKQVRKLIKKPSQQYSTWNGEEHLIEIKKSDHVEIPANWILVSSTKLFRRYHPPQVKAKLERKSRAKEALEIEANRVFQSFLLEISRDYYGLLRDAVNKLAVADCLLSLALVALQDGYTRPSFCEEDQLEIIDGRHPMVEGLRDEPFVPNSVAIGGCSPRHKVITGPNMGGKSSVVRMVAICIIMAQIGSYVPAKAMKLSLHDGLLVRMGASDELARGRSTFMVEMQETSDILHLSTKKTLVILDELGRGTSTFDGMAVASAVLQHLVQEVGCKTLFITHYPQVAGELEQKFPQDVQNLHMGFVEDTRIDGTREITFLFKLRQGMATGSFGIECARLAGLPEKLVRAAANQSEELRSLVIRRSNSRRIDKFLKLLPQITLRNPSDIVQSFKDLRLQLTGNDSKL